jgi:hypothetical protein
MRAHVLSAGVIVNTIEVDSLDAMPGLVDADIGGSIGDSIAGGVVVPKPGPSIASLRAALILKIDADVDAIYRVVQGDRAAEYLLAETEATAYKAANYTGNVPSSVASWSTAKAQTAKWATDDILTTAAGWRQAQAAMRASRLALKEQARTAPDLAPVAAQWSGFVTTIRAALGVPS